MKIDFNALMIPIEIAQKVLEVIAKVHKEKEKEGEIYEETIEEVVDVISWLIFKRKSCFKSEKG